MRTNAIVVEFARSPLPSSTIVNGSAASGSASASVWRAGQAAAERRAALEQVAELRAVLGRPVEGRASLACSSVSGSPSRSRIARRASSFTDFCWCVMLRPSPASPMPKPLIVFARITVGCPVVRTAAS